MTKALTELIDDREIAAFDDDRLGHEQIADQLVDLVCSIPTPPQPAAKFSSSGGGSVRVGVYGRAL